MKRLIYFGLCSTLFLVCAIPLKADNSHASLSIQSDIASRFRHYTKDKKLLEQLLDLLYGRGRPLTEQMIIASTRTNDVMGNFRGQGYILVWLYLHARKPSAVIDVYNHLPREYRFTYRGVVFTEFYQYIVPSYDVMLGDDFRFAATGSLDDPQRNSSLLEAADIDLGLLVQTHGTGLPNILLYSEEHSVCDDNLRFAIASTACDFGSADLPVVRWYYVNCANSAFAIQCFGAYLKRYLPSDEYSLLLQAKKQQLEAALSSLPAVASSN